MVVILILIVLFSSTALIVFKSIGGSSKEAGSIVSNLMDDSLGYSEVTESGGEYGVNLLKDSHKEKKGSREYLMYANLAPLFDEHGVGRYTFSFDLKSEKPGNISVYFSDRTASSIKYGWRPGANNISTTTEYDRYSITVDVYLMNEGANHSSLAFYGTYDSGRKPSVKNVKIEKGSRATPWSEAIND